jgi:hypothetical protein
MIKRDELTSEVGIKEPYDRPLLVRHGPLRDVTGQVSPVDTDDDSPADGGGDDTVVDGGVID